MSPYSTIGDDVEKQPFIDGVKVARTEQHQRQPWRKTLGLVGAATVALGGAFAIVSTTGSVPSMQQAALDTDSCMDATIPLNTAAWFLYKHTIPVSTETMWANHDLLTEFVSGASAEDPAILGCDGFKMTCNLGYSRLSGASSDSTALQLHLVGASALSTGDITMETWQTYFSDLNGNLSTFNAFMHNKVQLYTPDLTAVQDGLEALGEDYMKRLSGSGNQFAHLSMQISGRIYEFVGDSTQIDTTDFIQWDETECPQAHELEYDLDYYVAAYNAVNTDATFVSELTGFTMYKPIPVSFQMGTSDATSTKHSLLFSDLEQIPSASITTTVYDTCTVTDIDFPSMPDLRVKYVANDLATSGDTYSVEYYETYVEDQAASLTKNGRSWNHWLDQHIGVKSDESSDDTCQTVNAALVSHVADCSKGLGIRDAANETHSYVQYTGCMIWEWNMGSPTNADWICTCNEENNWSLWEAATGTQCDVPPM